MGKEYSMDIASCVRKYLTEEDWRYEFQEEKGIFRFSLSLKSKLQKISYLVDVKKSAVIVYGISPISVSEDDDDAKAKMAEFITRANYGLMNGCFEMDYRDGELRYRSYIDCDGQLPSQGIIRDSVIVTALMFERYSQGILSIIFTGADPKEAVEACEK